MWQDVRLAMRSVRRAPGIALVSALTLALGAGAATAVFALLNGVVLKPLPVERPRELVLFSDNTTEGLAFTGTPRGTLILYSTPSFEYLRAHQQTFVGVCAFQNGRDRVAARVVASRDSSAAGNAGGAELADVTRVSGNYFDVLGVRAQTGRLLADADDRAGAPPVAVISDAYWSRRFQRDPAVIGRSVTLRATPFAIVGVAARGFYGESMRASTDFWAPIATGSGQTGGYDEHHTFWLDLIGRLKPVVTMAQASVDVNARLQEFLIDEAGSRVTPERQDEIAHTTIALTRGDLGRSAIRAKALTPLTLLFVLVVLLLVTASINVASLLLARAAARDGVTAVHLMLGASRGRLVRLTVIETLAIVLPGLVAGIGVALATPRALLPLWTVTLPIDVSPDARMIAMIVTAAAVAIVVACAGPVWRVMQTCRGGACSARTRADQGRPLRSAGRALVGAQMALAVPLLMVAGLLLRSVDRLEGQHLALDRHHVLLADFGPSLAGSDRTPALSTMSRSDLLDSVRAQPHVVDATFASQTPLGGSFHGSSLRVEGRPPRDDGSAQAAFVGPRYLHTIGIPLVAGRDFTEQDDAAHPPVIILSEAAARVFVGQNAIGQRVAYGSRPFAEVIGIARDVKFVSLRAPAPRHAYLPQLQNGGYGGRLVIRTEGDPLQATPAMRDAIRRAMPNVPITKMTTMDEEIRAATAGERALAMSATLLASVTLLVSAIGLCGLLAYMVARRTRELGIRIALGASPGRVMRGVLFGALRVVAAGGVVGAIGAMATTKVVTSQLYDVSPADATVVVGAVAAMLTATLTASLLPARRASRVDPIGALRVD